MIVSNERTPVHDVSGDIWRIFGWHTWLYRLWHVLQCIKLKSYLRKETSFVYQGKRGFLCISGQNSPHIGKYRWNRGRNGYGNRSDPCFLLTGGRMGAGGLAFLYRKKSAGSHTADGIWIGRFCIKITFWGEIHSSPMRGTEWQHTNVGALWSNMIVHPAILRWKAAANPV